MTQETKSELKRNRSSANPKFNLDQTISFLEATNKAYGVGTYSRQAIAEALGHTRLNGSSTRKVASLVHFGLMYRKGNAYTQSDLAKRILLPVSEDDKVKAVMEAVQQPTLYAKLLGKYKGQSLPSMLSNILAREYGISSTVSKEVADTFTKSIEFAGMLTNGIITESIPETTSVNDQEDIDDSEDNGELDADDSSTAQPNIKQNITGKTVLELPCGIALVYPNSLAFNFALGEFAEVIKLMNEVAIKALKENASNGTNDDISNSELEAAA